MVRDPEGAKHDLSYMPQRFGLYEDLTVDENIRFYADLFGVERKRRDEHSTELLAAAGLQRVSQAPGRKSFGRNEAETWPGVRADSHAARHFARRADQWSRSRFTP